MPVKLGARLAPENAEARIEIVPLIDIMFFLLASFMLVSLSMVKLNDIKVNLPTGSASPDNSRNLLNITISRDGELFIDHTPVAENELARILADKRQHDPQLKVLISGDAQALHGRVVRAMDIVRQAGIDRVAIETTPTPASERP